MSFLDSIDRFAHAAKHSGQIFSDAAKRRPTPFADAVLRIPLGDLARDVDPSELGLFTLIPDPSSAPTVPHPDDSNPSATTATQKGNVARVEFAGATPLRKPAGMSKHARRENDKEPEVYAEAALKYLDRFQSIRPMPRARQEVEGIITRLNELRSEMAQLNGLPEVEVKDEPSLTEKIQDEEKRIQELTMRIKQMKARKDATAKKTRFSPADASGGKKNEEDDFWGSPPALAPRARNPRKSLLISNLARGALGPEDSLLLDSKINVDDGAMLDDVTMGSLAAPTPAPAPKPAVTAPLPEPPSFVDQSDISMQGVEMTPTPASSAAPQPLGRPTALNFSTAQSNSEPDVEMDMEDENEDADGTVILAAEPPSTRKRTPPPSSPPEHKRVRTDTPPPPEPMPAKALDADVFKVPATPRTAATPSKALATPGTARKNRVRITSDVERIVAKMWVTVGDIIMPGHPFNTATAASTNKPPAAKETIALLENLTTQTPSSYTASPSQTHSSLSIASSTPAPSTHIVLTAHLLLALLKAAPKYSMSLATAKSALAEANQAIAESIYTKEELEMGLGSDKATETRALYGCVAKRLLKIDRGGGEQVVRFVDI